MTQLPSLWAEPIDRFDQWLLAADKSPRTRELRRFQLVRAAHAFPDGPDLVTLLGLVEWLAAQPWAAETRRSQRACLRTFFHWTHAHGFTRTDPADGPSIQRAQPRPVQCRMPFGRRPR